MASSDDVEGDLQNLIREQADRIGRLESHIEHMSELFGQKEQTFASELHTMRFLMAEFVRLQCEKGDGDTSSSSAPLSIDISGLTDRLSVSEGTDDYAEVKMVESEDYRCAATQTDPLNSSDCEPDDLELTMDTVGELTGVDYQLEYEEITLRRSRSGRRLGLTLCYGNCDEYDDADIFVSEIEKGSIAAADGRIRVGDQILQVNHCNVSSRQEAVAQFNMNADEITLLLARPRLPENEDSNDEDEEIANVTDADLQQLVNHANSTNLSPLPENDDGDGQMTENSGGFEKDSGLSRVTDSDPDLVGITAELAGNGGGIDEKPSPGADKALEHELAFLRKEMETIRLECDRLLSKHNNAEKKVAQQVQQATNLMSTIDRLTAPQSPYRQLLNTTPSMASNTSSPARQFYPQQTQLHDPQFSPMLGYDHRNRGTPMNGGYPNGAHSNVMTANGRFRTFAQDDQTSSAYNTGGDSCRSTPMKGEYAHVIDMTGMHSVPRQHRPVHLTTRERVIEPQLSPNSEHPYHTIETPMSNATTIHFRPMTSVTVEPHPPIPTSSIPKRDRTLPHSEKQEKLAYKPGDIMYTSPENLAQTIALQQRLLRMNMAGGNSQHTSSPGSSKRLPPPNVPPRPIKEAESPQKYEWKVKRRADGTCYITRKPMRNQVLKAREEQLNKERYGISTDDDAASELKAGRFWSREERKRHLERSREKKANKIQHAMNKTVNPTEQMILQLSNRKQMRRSGRQLFDKFTTLQEFLAHGSRDPTAAPIGGILSVTTV
uniref:PDZ domain-containing protein n=2 Tax=Panagrellus redivivus TaxID=6233 RepID=A0A7E4UYG0_PANRE